MAIAATMAYSQLQQHVVETYILHHRTAASSIGACCKGYKSIEIAETLQLSKHTVDNHRKNMLKKSGTSNSM